MREPQSRTVRRFAPRQCASCPTIFTPACARHVRCVPCAKQHRMNYYVARHAKAKANKGRGGRHEQPKGRVQHIETRVGRYVFDPHFLLALPALRAELDRVAPPGATPMRRDYRHDDPADIGHGGRRRND